MGKIKEQLAGVAALIGVLAAIGGGFVKYGEITTKLDALESANVKVEKIKVEKKEKKIEVKSKNKIDKVEKKSKSIFSKIKSLAQKKIK